MMLVTLAAILFGWLQSSPKGDQPLVSATNPAYLSCTVWTGREWSKPAATRTQPGKSQVEAGGVVAGRAPEPSDAPSG